MKRWRARSMGMQASIVALLSLAMARPAVSLPQAPTTPIGEIRIDVNRDRRVDIIAWGTAPGANGKQGGSEYAEEVWVVFAEGLGGRAHVTRCDTPGGVAGVDTHRRFDGALLLEVRCEDSYGDAEVRLFAFEPEVRLVWRGAQEGGRPVLRSLRGGRMLVHREMRGEACDRSPGMARVREATYAVSGDLVPRFSGWRWTKEVVDCAQLAG